MQLLALYLLLAWPFSQDVPDHQIVARAKGSNSQIEITAGRLKAYAKGREDRTPQALLQDLIDFELLVDEARSKGLDDRPEVQAAASIPMVERYLVENFEKSNPAESIPQHYVEQAYRQNQHFYVHPELREAVHLLITSENSRMPQDQSQVEVARQLASRISDAFQRQPPESKEEFMDTAELYRPEIEALGLHLRVEDLGRFAEHDRYVEDFIAPCFEIQAEGQTTPPIRTIFGFHVAYITAILPAINSPVEKVEADIRQRILNDYRVLKLSQLVEKIAQGTEALINTTPLEAVDQRRGLNQIEP